MKIINGLIVSLIMSILYFGIELLYRGFSFWQMILISMIICFFIDNLNEGYLEWEMPLWFQTLVAFLFAVTGELIGGVIFNSDYSLWDYRLLPFNYLGYIQAYYSLAWIPLSLVCIIISDWVRFILFNEEKPHYKLL